MLRAASIVLLPLTEKQIQSFPVLVDVPGSSAYFWLLCTYLAHVDSD